MLWHQRLSHIGEKGLWILKKKIIVDGLNNCSLEFDLCVHNIYGKQKHVQFYSSPHNSFRLLDLAHSEVFDPIKFLSISKDLYYMSLIDDYYRRT